MFEGVMVALWFQLGTFEEVTNEACACVDEACRHYFANLDQWNRASQIPEGEVLLLKTTNGE